MRTTAFFASVVFALLPISNSQAATVTTILTLDTPSASANRLNLGLSNGVAQTDLTGTIIAEIEINLATGAISSINLTGGDMTATSWMMTGVNLGPPLGVVNVSSTAASATAATIPEAPAVPPTAVTGTSFDAEDQFIRLTNGAVSIDAPGVPDTPLAGTDIPGTGSGTITSTLIGDQYNILFSMNIDDSQDISGAPLAIAGAISAQGTVSAIPEPACAVSLLGLFTGIVISRRRR